MYQNTAQVWRRFDLLLLNKDRECKDRPEFPTITLPGTVTGAAEDDEDEAGVDEMAASSSRTAEETIALRSTRDTVTVPGLSPATDVVGGVIEGSVDPAEDITEIRVSLAREDDSYGVGRGMEVPELSKSRLTQLLLSACAANTRLLSGRSLRRPSVPSSLTMFNSYLAKQHYYQSFTWWPD